MTDLRVGVVMGETLDDGGIGRNDEPFARFGDVRLVIGGSRRNVARGFRLAVKENLRETPSKRPQ